ncbi:hypothetical protein BDV27DRAFT_165686 [Aspergillus caelatus]|uniref:Uncharacterized protein n=1 Tax=Aspergillus caelatus TaxID=61420 RepID=A0A5N6ZZW5_9EURO|nr:uncharacterized protein BDV27DRAFT_165686 [Aspergillus caelatus]KAE8363137.1 hypothetical protein BDV27DRAFT_165686 [Aspergillus caelatus]
MTNETHSTISSSYTRITMDTSNRTSSTQPIIRSSASTTSLIDITRDDIESLFSWPTTTTESSLASFFTPLNDNLVSFGDELSSYSGTTTDSWNERDLNLELNFDNSISDNVAPTRHPYIPQTPRELDYDDDNKDGCLIIHGPIILLTTLKQKDVSAFLKNGECSIPVFRGENLVIRNFDSNINELINDPAPWTPYTLSTRLLTLEGHMQDTPGTKLSTKYPPIKTWGRRKVGYRVTWLIDQVFRYHGICIRGFGVDVACISSLERLVPVVRLEAAREASVRAWSGAVRDVGLAGLWDLVVGSSREGSVEVDVDVDIGSGGLDIDRVTFRARSVMYVCG